MKIALNFVCFIGMVMVAVAIMRLWKGWRTLGWQAAAGTVQSAQWREVRDSDTDTDPSYEALITYTYEVAGQRYVSSRAAIGGLFGSRSQAEQRCAHYAPGTAVQVFHNPRRPERAVLERQALGWPVPALALGGLAIFIGALALFPGHR